jgi:hypothetical protein
MPKIGERKHSIGEWLESHVMGSILKADMQGHEFKKVLNQLKSGQKPS